MRTLSRMYVSSGQSIFDSPSGVFSVTVNMHAAGARFTARAAGKAAGATRASALARNARAAANKTKKETVVKDRSRVVCRGEISRTGRWEGRHGRLRTDGFVQHLGSGEIDDGARRSRSATSCVVAELALSRAPSRSLNPTSGICRYRILLKPNGLRTQSIQGIGKGGRDEKLRSRGARRQPRSPASTIVTCALA